MAWKCHSGIKKVRSVDHAERLVDMPTVCMHVDVWPLSTNTGNIFVGGPETVASSEQGAQLDYSRNDSFQAPFYPFDLMDLWIDATVAANGVKYLYWVDE